jgi:hypothetical protein
MKKNFKEINPELKEGDFIMLLHMDGEFLSVGTKGVVKEKIPQPKQRPTDSGYGYKVNWYDKEGNIISTYPLFPEDDGWVFDREYYESNDNINESAFDMFSNIESLVEWGEFFQLFSKTELNTICELLELERRSGFFNMITEGGSFLLSGPEYIKDFIRLQSYRKEFEEEDEEVHKLILSRAQKVKDIFIRNSMKYLEDKGQEVEIPKIQRMMVRLARTAKKHWMNNADKYLNKEIK